MARVTVEDCLEKIPNRFALVTIASKRARELMAGADAKVRCKNREQVTALREIAKGFIVPDQNVAELEEQTVEQFHEDPNF